MSESYEYSVAIIRHGDEDTVILDKRVTADDAIALLLHISEHVEDAAEAEDDPEEEGEEEIALDAEEPEPKQARGPRKCSSCGRPGHTARTCPKADGEADGEPAAASPEQEPAYDRDAVLQDIASGMRLRDIAEKHNISFGTVSNLKALSNDYALPKVKCAKCDEWGHEAADCKFFAEEPEPPAEEPTTSIGFAPAEDRRSLRERVKELHDDGLMLEEVYDYLPLEDIAEVSAIYEDLERKRKN